MGNSNDKPQKNRSGKSGWGENDLAFAREVISLEAKAISGLTGLLGEKFLEACRMIFQCRGRVIVTGMGKPGIIGRKTAATLASTGTPSLFLHPAEAVHGDLGMVLEEDVVLVLSNSGETDEILRLLPHVKRIGARLIAITGSPDSNLAGESDVVLSIGEVSEAKPLGLVPTASSAAMLAVGDALAMCVMKHRDFGKDEFAMVHPGGAVGRKLVKVKDVMRKGESLPIVGEKATIEETVRVMTETSGRPGAALVVDEGGKLAGIFTDGDLRRLVLRGEVDFKRRVSQVMTRNPMTVKDEQVLEEAVNIIGQRKIDQLAVVDGAGKPAGLLDVQDLVEVRAV